MFEVLFKPYNEGEERKGHMKEKRRMISEAARQLGLETYNLRTWEEEFSLTIPRNEKGYRYYGEKEIRTFEQIRDLKNAGLDSEEIKRKLSGNIIPFPAGKQINTSEKMKEFQKVLVKIMGQAILEQKDYIADQISSKVSDRVAKEVDYQFRLRESEEEQRFKKLDEMIRNQQKAREEIAASRERRHFLKRKRKEK